MAHLRDARPTALPRRQSAVLVPLLLLLAVLLLAAPRRAAAAGPIAAPAADPFAFEPETELGAADEGTTQGGADSAAVAVEGGEKVEEEEEAEEGKDGDDDERADDEDEEADANAAEEGQPGAAAAKTKKKKKKIHTTAGTKKRRRRSDKAAAKADPSRMRANERREYEAQMAEVRAKAREEAIRAEREKARDGRVAKPVWEVIKEQEGAEERQKEMGNMIGSLLLKLGKSGALESVQNLVSMFQDEDKIESGIEKLSHIIAGENDEDWGDDWAARLAERLGAGKKVAHYLEKAAEKLGGGSTDVPSMVKETRDKITDALQRYDKLPEDLKEKQALKKEAEEARAKLLEDAVLQAVDEAKDEL